MMSSFNFKSIALAGVLAAVASTASAATLGQRLADGSVSEAAYTQLVAGSGLSDSEARGMTVHEVMQVKFKDD